MPDPTEKRADETQPLRQSDVLERVTDGIVALDSDYRYTYVNEQAERILDKSRDQLLGQCLWNVFPETKGTIAQEKIEAAMATQDQQSFERHNSERGQWFEVRIYPDDSGLSIYFTDVTERKTSKEKLARTNRRLTALVENTLQAVYLKDRQGRYQLMNEAAAAFFGLDPEDAVGKRDEDLFDAESASQIRDLDEQILEHEEADSRETIRYIDGNEHVFLGNKHPYHDEDGEVVGIMGISRDITDRKQSQRRLEQSRKRLQSLYQELPDAVIIHDAEGNVVDVNEQTVDDLGYSREELLSMNVARIEAGLDAEDLRDIWGAMEVGDRHKVSSRHRRKDGSTFPVEVWVDKVKIGDEEQFIALGRDVTDQRRNERKLEALTEEYHALLDNADDAIFLLDVDEKESDVEIRFERLNPYHEAATGLTTEAVRGKTPREALGPDLGAELEANYRRCVEAGEPISYQETLEFPEGTRTWETKLAPVVIDGAVTRIIGIARDVTTRVQREEELRRQNERLDEFAGVVAHDLRNPLNIAQGRTTLAVEELARNDYESPHLPKAQQALGRMEDIIMDTLVLARRGDEVESPKPVAVAEVAGQCWDMVETDEASLIVEDECTVKGDPDRLRHVFENLFRNAVEHGGDDVTVRVGRAGESTLYVEDDGPGVPPDNRDTVCEPGQSSRENGTGFGLAIVKRIAEAHGWNVALTEADSGGARFVFSAVDFLSR
jgi:two-component system, sporulation sensor kinase E